jgi:predicted ATPase/DNA-binding SARP family transcriptional activator
VDLTIALLGGFRVTVDGQPIPDTAWRRRKAGTLVKVLALAPGQALHREQALDLLWPDLEPEAAQRNLRQALHAARRALEEGAPGAGALLGSRGERLALQPAGELRIDVVAFERAANAARRGADPADYEAALARYGGELLPEDRYEDWAAARRAALATTAQALRLDLARLREERGEVAAAIEALRGVVTDEPTHEAAAVALMRLYARAGQRHLALRHFQLLAEALRDELAAEPEPATRRLHDDILAGRFPASGGAGEPRPAGTGSAPARGVPRRPPLPAQLTRLIGRAREIEEIGALLDGVNGTPARLVTLTGVGGCGKTRLALAVAASAGERFPGGAWWVELAALSDWALVPDAVARVVGVRELPGQAVADQLVEALRPEAALLVLDNCEHLVEACAALAQVLLAACPQLAILATSREALLLPGEVAWQVRPLAVPALPELPPGTPLPPERLAALAGSEAMLLLLDRLRAHQPGFALNAANGRALGEICRRLDGIPLALELAAARLAVLAPEQLAARLDDAPGLLVGAGRGVPERQQTLRATLDWSYDLLDPAERRMLRQLAVFAGGCGIDAAEAVGGGQWNVEHDTWGADALRSTSYALRSADTLDTLARLMEKSLVLVEHGATEARYRLLEPVRQYARTRLEEAGEAAGARERHARHYLALAERAAPELVLADRGEAVALLAREEDNLRAALAWAQGADADVELRLVVSLWWFWVHHNRWGEGRRWLTAALARSSPVAGDLAALWAEAAGAAGFLAWTQGDLPAARDFLERAVGRWRALGGAATGAAGFGWALNLLAMQLLGASDLAGARALVDEAMRFFRANPHAYYLPSILASAGIVATGEGDYDAAAGHLEESVALHRAEGDGWALSLPLRSLGLVALRRGEYGRAVAMLRESLAVLGERVDVWFLTRSLYLLATAVALRGHPLRAARLFGAQEALGATAGAAVLPYHREDYARGIAAVRAGLDEGTLAAAWGEGRALTHAQALAEALATPGDAD